MADSRRELALKAVRTALQVASVTKNSETTTKPAELNVHRHLTRQVVHADLPDCTVFYIGERVAPISEGAVDESLRFVRVGVRCREKAPKGVTGDEALDPILVWAELSVLNDHTLGGLVADSHLAGIDAISAREFADEFAEATLEFEFKLQTKWGDPRQAP